MEKVISDKSDLFHEYILKYKDEAKAENIDGYFHVDVVAEAYQQGFSDGEKKGKQDIVATLAKRESELFTRKANQIYILTHNIISFSKDKGYLIDSMHINLTPSFPKIVIAVSSKLLTNDEFVEQAYAKIFENKKIFSQLFPEPLDIGLVSSDTLDHGLIKEAGFGYSEIFN